MDGFNPEREEFFAYVKAGVAGLLVAAAAIYFLPSGPGKAEKKSSETTLTVKTDIRPSPQGPK